jgi:hypothetical protein
MAITRGRLLALLAFAANIVAAVFLSTKMTRLPGTPRELALIATIVALPGLVIVWFQNELSETGFARGVLHASPAFLVGLIGWLLLLAYPFWFVCQSSGGLLPLQF